MKRTIAALAVALVCVASAKADEGTTGKVKSVNTEKKEIVLKGVTSDTNYEVSKDAVLWLDGRPCKLNDLKADDRVTILYNKVDNHFTTKYVRGLRAMDEANGTIDELSADKKQIIIKGIVKNTTYDVTNDATIWIDGKKGSLSDLRSGDEVRITHTRTMSANDVVVTKRK